MPSEVIGIVDLGMGNLRSVANAVDCCGCDPLVVADPKTIADCSHLILPGVGSFRAASEVLHGQGFADAIRDHVAAGKPLLGTCLGMQLLLDVGSEGLDGGATSPGLGLIPGTVERYDPGPDWRIPHVGWNSVDFVREHCLLADLKPKRDFYFVHSYHAVLADDSCVLGRTEHGRAFVSAVAKDSVVGFQFHPEKSQANGLRLLENFCFAEALC